MKLLPIIIIALLFSCTKQEPVESAKGGKPPVVTPPPPPPPPPPLPVSVLLTTPRVGDQGNEGSCTAWSVVNAKEIEDYYKYGFMNLFSCEYVFNQTKMGTDCNSGTSFTLALNLMKNKGVCLESQMPLTDGCSLYPTALQDSQAFLFKINGFTTLLNTDTTGIKAKIIAKHPVMFSVVMDNSFINAPAGFVWSVYSGSGSFPHAMVIVGYDDTKRAYKVMNCWGTTWGDQGFSWIDYNFFATKTGYYVYTITL